MLNDADSVKTEVTGTQPCDLVNPPPSSGDGKDTDHSMRNLFILLFAFVMLAVLALLGLYLIGFLGLEEEKTPPVTINKPYCGDEKCGVGESCENCAKDCVCNVSAPPAVTPYTAPQSYYSVDLPDVRGRLWNVTYTPATSRFYVMSPYCFVLNIESPSGAALVPYAARDSYGGYVYSCRDTWNALYNTTGEGSATWFNMGGCPATKYYEAEPGAEYVLHINDYPTAGSSCYRAQFDIYENFGALWTKYEGVDKNATDTCSGITDVNSRSECYFHLGVKRMDVKTCAEIDANQTWRKDYCIRLIAIRSLNKSICKGIEAGDTRDFCYWQIAAEKVDHTLCAEMNNTLERDTCYRTIAYNKNDSVFCGYCAISDQRDWCYKYIAYERKDTSICEKINQSDTRYLCMADVTKDASFCGEIETEHLKEDCLANYAAKTDSLAGRSPYCGDGMCSAYEDYITCPRDCGREEKNYSVDLPFEPGGTWSLTYTPNSDEIKISSDSCFYLEVNYSSGPEINPYKADVATCRSAAGKIYNATGEGSAAWFAWNGCAKEKYYKVIPGKQITFYVRTDKASCRRPQFYVYENLMGEWLQKHIDYKEIRTLCLTEGWGYGYPLTPEGLAEGEKYANETCCEGLTKLFDNYTIDPEGKCQNTAGYTRWFCSKCGDDKCDERYENKCNCPEDCALPAGNASKTDGVGVITPDCPESGPLEGIYFGGNGTVLGKCMKMNSNCSQYVDYFNLQEEFIGSCWVYSGPGGSGYEGGCSNSVVGDPNASGVQGAASRRYYCFIPKYPVVSLNVKSPDISPFIEYGCESDPRKMDWLNCSKTGLQEEYSCVDNGSMKPSAGIFIPPKYLGYLKPQIPIVSCSETFLRGGPESAICSEGTPLMRYYQRYIVMTPQGPQSIASREDFVKAFSPVESPEEALAFAVALTCDSPVLPDLTQLQENTLYKTDTTEFMEYTKKAAENVSTINIAEYYNGYEISLYKTERVGCGKPVYKMLYFVYRNGTVLEMDKETVIQVPGPCWA